MKVEKIRDVAVKIDCDISKLTEQDYQDIKRNLFRQTDYSIRKSAF